MFNSLDIKRFRDEPVAILTGGTSREREISLKTGQAFEEALRARGYEVEVYDVATDLPRLSAATPSAVLLGIHGGLGERGALQGFLECLKIPYTGSGVLASALAMDKHRTRTICSTAAIPVADGLWFDADDPDTVAHRVARVDSELGFPVVAKLNDSGSSFGVYICHDGRELTDALKELDRDVEATSSAGILVESFVEGPEYTVGLFGDHCLGVIEIQPGEGFYDFEAKYESNQTGYEIITEASICDPLVAWAKRAFEILGCRGVARIDFKGRPDKQGAVAMLEANTIPGMTSTSLVPKMAAHQGMAFEDFVEAMLAAARLDVP